MANPIKDIEADQCNLVINGLNFNDEADLGKWFLAVCKGWQSTNEPIKGFEVDQNNKSDVVKIAFISNKDMRLEFEIKNFVGKSKIEKGGFKYKESDNDKNNRIITQVIGPFHIDPSQLVASFRVIMEKVSSYKGNVAELIKSDLKKNSDDKVRFYIRENLNLQKPEEVQHWMEIELKETLDAETTEVGIQDGFVFQYKKHAVTISLSDAGFLITDKPGQILSKSKVKSELKTTLKSKIKFIPEIVFQSLKMVDKDKGKEKTIRNDFVRKMFIEKCMK